MALLPVDVSVFFQAGFFCAVVDTRFGTPVLTTGLIVVALLASYGLLRRALP